jgi:hypothetical protein
VFKAITRRDEDEPKPEARRRRGETDKGLVIAWHDRGAAVARGRYAALQPAKEVEASACAADPYAAATADLSGTFVDLDCMNPYWPPDAEYDAAIDEHFSSQQDRYFPQP